MRELELPPTGEIEQSFWRAQLSRIAQIGGRLGLVAALSAGGIVAQDSNTPARAEAFINDYPNMDAVPHNVANYDWWVDEDGDGKKDITANPYDDDELVSSRGYYYRNCTDGASYWAQKYTGTDPRGWGDAASWNESAASRGHTVKPGNSNGVEPGDIAQSDDNTYGHVGFVTAVNKNTAGSITSINIVELNGDGRGSYSDKLYNTRNSAGKFSRGSSRDWDHFIDVNGAGKGLNNQPIDVNGGGGSGGKEVGPDLFSVLHLYTSSGQTDVRRLNGKTNYTSWVGGWPSADGWHVSSDVSYVAGDHNRDGRKDIYQILHQNSPSGLTEVKILDGASNYSRYLGGWVTPEGWHSGAGTDYDLGDFNRDGVNDMFVVQHQNTSSGHTEVKILDGKSNFTRHIGGWVSADGLHSDNDVSYAVGDYTGDGKPDVYSIQHWNSNSGRVEVRVLDGATNYTSWVGGWVTPEGWHDGGSVDYDVGYYDGDSKPEVYQILHAYTSSGQTEVKVLNGASNYTNWVGGWVTPDGWHGGDGVDYSLG